jgi:biopolymer transport protein ExbD
MLHDRLRSNRRICRVDFAAFTSFLVALATLLVWAMPAGFHDGVPITPPSTASAIALWRARREDALQVLILRDAKIFFDRRQIRPEELPSRLQERIRAGAPRKVYIRADARVRYRTVMAVLDDIRSAGLSDIAFITH